MSAAPAPTPPRETQLGFLLYLMAVVHGVATWPHLRAFTDLPVQAFCAVLGIYAWMALGGFCLAPSVKKGLGAIALLMMGAFCAFYVLRMEEIAHIFTALVFTTLFQIGALVPRPVRKKR